MKTLGEMSVAEQDEAFRRLVSRMDKTEVLLFGGFDNPSQGIFHLVTQLTQTIASQGLQMNDMQRTMNDMQRMMQDGLSKKMDVVVDETNQPISVSILAHDVSEIRKMLQKGLLYLAGIGLAALLLLGRTAYNVFPALQDFHK
jgi:hypothetical protein